MILRKMIPVKRILGKMSMGKMNHGKSYLIWMLAAAVLASCLCGCHSDGSSQTRKKVKNEKEPKESQSGDTSDDEAPDEDMESEDDSGVGGTAVSDMQWEPVYVSGTYGNSDHPDPPHLTTYLDETRDLKDTYSLEEIGQKHAFRLYHSTLIYTACDTFSPSYDFSCMDYGNNDYYVEAHYSCRDYEGKDVRRITLKDTSCMSLDDFEYALLTKNLNTAPVVTEGIVIEKTDDTILACVLVEHPLRFGNYYEYYLAKSIGGRVYLASWETQHMYNDEAPQEWTDKEREEFMELAEVLFEHLKEDDGKTPYIYDMWVNVGLPAGYRFCTYGKISSVGGNKVHISAGKEIGNCIMTINPEDVTSTKDGYWTEWKDAGDVKVREAKYGGMQVLVEDDNKTYLFEFYQDVEITSSDDLYAILENAGTIEK